MEKAITILLVGVLLALFVNIYYLHRVLKIRENDAYKDFVISFFLRNKSREELAKLGVIIEKERKK